MQALSLAVHIPIVCFGIAFPAMFLFVEGLYLRTGDPTYKALAKRWSKVALILFAVGVVTGTILSFEFGLLWPEFMATLRRGVRDRVRARGHLVLRRGDLHRDLRLRLGPAVAARALPDRHPGRAQRLRRLVQRDRGQRLDERPDGLRRRRRARSSTRSPWEALFNSNMWHELIHMYLAGYLVAGFIVAGVYASAWLRGRRDRYHRTALVVTLAFASLAAPVQVIVGDWAGREVAERQPVKLAAIEGLQQHAGRARRSRSAASTTSDAARCASGSRSRKLLSLLAYHDPNATVIGLDVGAARGPPAGQHRPLRVPDDGRDRHRAGAARRRGSSGTWWRKRRLPRSPLVLPGGDGRRAAVVRRADRGLDHDRGRPPAVDRLRGHAHRAGGHRRPSGLEVGYVVLVARLRRARRRGRLAAAPARAQAAETEVAVAMAEVCAGARHRSASPPTRCSAAPTSAPASGT